MKKIFSDFLLGFEIFKVILKYEPFYLFFAIPQIIINAVLPLFYIYFPKLIIEQLIKDNAGDYAYIVKIIVVYSVIIFVMNVTNTILMKKCNTCTEKFILKLKNEIGNIAMQLELKNIESASNRDIIALASNATGLTKTIELVQNIISNTITIAGLAYIIVQLDFIFIVLVALTLFIKMIFVKIQHNVISGYRLKYAQNDRVGNYLTDMQYFNIGGAKEIRLNNVQDWFMDKITDYRKELLYLQYGEYKLYILFQILSPLILAIQSLVILLILSKNYIDNIINIADFTMYFGAVTAISTSLSTIAELIGEYNRQLLNISDLNKFTSLKPTNKPKFELDNINVDTIKLEFVNVSFSYPQNDTLILNNLNITINDKEKLVIVGLNGAGKSTFIKLLCKFYKPTSGVIKLNGVDIWNIPNEKYYMLIAAVFQDFTNFAFSINENVSMTENNKQNILKALNESGLEKLITGLPKGADTILYRQFDIDGIELSGGQEQKLAITRAIYKDAPILILDEPTASLDPKAESEIYEHFFELAKNKTTILISHRLASSTIADKIAVFSAGQIAEYGSHIQLMNIQGIYAEMFEKQSKYYLDENNIF